MYLTIRRRHLLAALSLFLAAAILFTVPRLPRAVQAAAWGLHFSEDGERPQGNAEAAYLKQFDAWYAAGSDGEKVIYLTFDAGYDNGYTEPILNTLQKHGVPAAFFVVGHFVETRPDLIRRMVQEGHVVGNHTNTHPDMAAIAEEAAFAAELQALRDRVEAVTGMPMEPFYRPPRGIYSEENLRMAQKLGYTTVFWSLAYVDWKTDDQPTREQALEKLLPRIHPGAVVLLHSTSATNAAVLDEVITRWKAMGYTFASLRDLPRQ